MDEDTKVFNQIKQFYHDHPKAPRAVKDAVREIRGEFDGKAAVLQDEFEDKHRKILNQYLHIELEYLESWISTGKVGFPKGRWLRNVFSRFTHYKKITLKIS